MTKKVVAAVVGVVVVVISWYVFVKSDDASPSSASGNAAAPAAVTAIPVELTVLDVKEKLPGRTSAYRIAQIRPQVSGIVVKRLFAEGTEVKQGEQLYQLDPASYAAEVDRAKAQVRNAKANAEAVQRRLDRSKQLIETRAISQQDYDDVKTSLEQALAAVALHQAALKTAELNLAYTRVYAPIAGRIGRSQVTEGALVTANQAATMAVITQLDPIYVDVTQSAKDNMQLRSVALAAEKIKVDIDTASFPGGYQHQGELQFSDVLVEESTGSVQLRALFPNPEHQLLPGLFVNAILHLGKQKVILIPQQALNRDPTGNAFVWKVEPDNTVTRTSVEAARAVGNQWLITAGLSEGESIVVEGMQRLAPGIKVNPTPKGE